MRARFYSCLLFLHLPGPVSDTQAYVTYLLGIELAGGPRGRAILFLLPQIHFLKNNRVKLGDCSLPFQPYGSIIKVLIFLYSTGWDKSPVDTHNQILMFYRWQLDFLIMKQKVTSLNYWQLFQLIYSMGTQCVSHFRRCWEISGQTFYLSFLKA